MNTSLNHSGAVDLCPLTLTAQSCEYFTYDDSLAQRLPFPGSCLVKKTGLTGSLSKQTEYRFCFVFNN